MPVLAAPRSQLPPDFARQEQDGLTAGAGNFPSCGKCRGGPAAPFGRRISDSTASTMAGAGLHTRL
jgi:hypothetical protein